MGDDEQKWMTYRDAAEAYHRTFDMLGRRPAGMELDRRQNRYRFVFDVDPDREPFDSVTLSTGLTISRYVYLGD